MPCVLKRYLTNFAVLYLSPFVSSYFTPLLASLFSLFTVYTCEWPFWICAVPVVIPNISEYIKNSNGDKRLTVISEQSEVRTLKTRSSFLSRFSIFSSSSSIPEIDNDDGYPSSVNSRSSSRRNLVHSSYYSASTSTSVSPSPLASPAPSLNSLISEDTSISRYSQNTQATSISANSQTNLLDEEGRTDPSRLHNQSINERLRERALERNRRNLNHDFQPVQEGQSSNQVREPRPYIKGDGSFKRYKFQARDPDSFLQIKNENNLFQYCVYKIGKFFKRLF